MHVQVHVRVPSQTTRRNSTPKSYLPVKNNYFKLVNHTSLQGKNAAVYDTFMCLLAVLDQPTYW